MRSCDRARLNLCTNVRNTLHIAAAPNVAPHTHTHTHTHTHKWRGGGVAGGGRLIVSATVLLNRGEGFELGGELTVRQDLVAEVGVFYDWDAATGFFLARGEPLLFSGAGPPAAELSKQALPPLPQDTDSPAGADRLDAVLVLPLVAISRCASEGHYLTKFSLGDVLHVLDEPHPRAIRKAFYKCESRKTTAVGADGRKTRRFKKYPTLADINEYFPKVGGMG